MSSCMVTLALSSHCLQCTLPLPLSKLASNIVHCSRQQLSSVVSTQAKFLSLPPMVQFSSPAHHRASQQHHCRGHVSLGCCCRLRLPPLLLQVKCKRM